MGDVGLGKVTLRPDSPVMLSPEDCCWAPGPPSPSLSLFSAPFCSRAMSSKPAVCQEWLYSGSRQLRTSAQPEGRVLPSPGISPGKGTHGHVGHFSPSWGSTRSSGMGVQIGHARLSGDLPPAPPPAAPETWGPGIRSCDLTALAQAGREEGASVRADVNPSVVRQRT